MEMGAARGVTDASVDAASAESTAGLVQVMLDAEAERQARQADANGEVLFADDLLPGVASVVESFVGIGQQLSTPMLRIVPAAVVTDTEFGRALGCSF